MCISAYLILTTLCGYSQKARLSLEMCVNPAFTKTWVPDKFWPPFSSDTYSLIFGKGEPNIRIIGYNYGISIGILIKNRLEYQITFSKALKGQRNSKDYNPIGMINDFGMYTENSDELTLSIKLHNLKLFKVGHFNFLIGVILSHYSKLTAGYYLYNNFWTDPYINSRAEITDPTFSIFRPGVTTGIEYKLLNNDHFSFNIGIKINQYFSAFNSNFNSSLGGRPRGYAVSIGPAFNLNYIL